MGLAFGRQNEQNGFKSSSVESGLVRVLNSVPLYDFSKVPLQRESSRSSLQIRLNKESLPEARDP